MGNFVGFKDGRTFVNDEHLEAVRVNTVGNEWVVTVYLRYPNGEKSEYGIYRGASEAEAKTRLDSFMAIYSSVTYIE